MEDERQSLIDRAVERLSPAERAPRREPRWTIDWRFALALGAALALAPLLAIVGAALATDRIQSQTAVLRAQAAPRLAARASERAARDALRDAVRAPTVATWLDRVAQVLPADARVSRMERSAQGRVELAVAAPDPDQLRGAMRRDAAMAGFREVGQRRAGAMILVTYRRTK